MVLPFSSHNQTLVYISVFYVSLLGLISPSYDFIALIKFGELFKL